MYAIVKLLTFLAVAYYNALIVSKKYLRFIIGRLTACERLVNV